MRQILRWHRMKQDIEDGQARQGPNAMELYLTDICNLKCLHCNIWQKNNAKPQMSLEAIRQLFMQAYGMGLRYVGYTGGEPMLHRDFVQVIKLGHDFGFKQHVTTNATIMTAGKAEALAEYCDTVGVSVDGIGPVFEEIRRTPWTNVERGLGLLMDAGANVSLGLVITHKNIQNVPAVIDYADERGLDLGVQPYNKGGVVMPDGVMLGDEELALRPEDTAMLSLLMVHFAQRLPKQAQYHALLYDYAMHDQKSTSCYISFDKFVVEANGDLRPCHIFPTVGNVFAEPLYDLWYSDRYNGLRKEMMACRKCYLGCYEHINIDINTKLGTL